MADLIRKFIVPCKFGPSESKFALYIGEPKADAHPVQHQDNWVSKERGGSISPSVKDSFARLHKISMEYGVSFSDLCAYALSLASDDEQQN